MAPKRNQHGPRPTVTPNVTPVNTPDAVITPNVETPNENNNIFQKFEEMQDQMRLQNETIRNLTKEVAKAKGDISEDAKDAKRKYGYEMDGRTRRDDEQFEYGFRVLVHERKEKVVISTQTIGRPVTSTNYNTGKRINQHDIEITFHDNTKTEMDALEFINQFYVIKQIVPDSNIAVVNGKKNYTFDTEKFGTFTVAENFIN